jgi:hypothetical protein
MSTGHMPEPIDTPTSKTPATANAEDVSGAAVESGAAGVATAPADLNTQMATIIEEQADTIAQKLVYNVQQLYAVSAVAIDYVNARNSALTVANALRTGAMENAENSLVNAGDSQIQQVNDQTLPFKNNALVAGMLEGILLDAVSRGLGGDGTQRAAATEALDAVFQRANERADRQSRAMLAQWPGGGPNARS